LDSTAGHLNEQGKNEFYTQTQPQLFFYWLAVAMDRWKQVEKHQRVSFSHHDGVFKEHQL